MDSLKGWELAYEELPDNIKEFRRFPVHNLGDSRINNLCAAIYKFLKDRMK